jgi:corrinoid protein of di/trimethylamine methyltransferase
MADDFSPLLQAIIDGDKDAAEALTRGFLDAGRDPLTVVTEGLVPAMAVVGEKFQRNEYYLPEMLTSARAMKACMALARPRLASGQAAGIGTVVIGTVKGDLHDIGKNLVAAMLEGAGFRIIDLGADTPPAKFVAAVREHQADLVGLSALLTTTMPLMREVIRALQESSMRDRVRVIIGGAPVTQQFANDIGADGYAADAVEAVGIFKALRRSA